jgi:hypothetical protein
MSEQEDHAGSSFGSEPLFLCSGLGKIEVSVISLQNSLSKKEELSRC